MTQESRSPRLKECHRADALPTACRSVDTQPPWPRCRRSSREGRGGGSTAHSLRSRLRAGREESRPGPVPTPARLPRRRGGRCGGGMPVEARRTAPDLAREAAGPLRGVRNLRQRPIGSAPRGCRPVARRARPVRAQPTAPRPRGRVAGRPPRRAAPSLRARSAICTFTCGSSLVSPITDGTNPISSPRPASEVWSLTRRARPASSGWVHAG